MFVVTRREKSTPSQGEYVVVEFLVTKVTGTWSWGEDQVGRQRPALVITTQLWTTIPAL